MKVLRNVLLFLLVSLLYAPVASAQNGAVIVRGQDNFGDFFWDGEDLLVVVSTDLGFFCADEEDLFPYDWMELWRPDGSLKFHENGNLFTRVYQPATPDDFWGPEGYPDGDYGSCGDCNCLQPLAFGLRPSAVRRGLTGPDGSGRRNT